MNSKLVATATAYIATAILGVALLSGCAGPVAQPHAGYSGADPKSSTTATPEPSPSGTASPKQGFVDSSKGAPVVHRAGELPAAKKAAATAATFATKSGYPDGVTLAVSDFARGTTTDQGKGEITGAPFIIIAVTVHNGSTKPLNLAAVVATLKYGSNLVAAPYYGTEAKVGDFYGTLAAGKDQVATYGFQLPKSTNQATLYVDLDGAHQPAAFTGTIPN
ncbi:DUF4352 domain-containing protein [Diaminobutyricibacter sp. McL0608]|uniref:DUF4352 domain-containing protein n=1 Tax=Leifsonia sp. McL0608 TaxID=3143537 RepID=UPI0031F31E87